MSLPVNVILFPPLKWLLHDHIVGQGWDGFKNTFQICINAIYYLPGSLSKAAVGYHHISSRHAIDHKKSGLGSIQQWSQDLSKHKSWLSHSVTAGMLVPKDQPLDCDSTRMFTLVLDPGYLTHLGSSASAPQGLKLRLCTSLSTLLEKLHTQHILSLDGQHTSIYISG